MPVSAEHLDSYLSIPYILTVESARSNGEWVCRLSYHELPGCVTESQDPHDALDKIEALRRETIANLLERGVAVPVPRRALRI